MHMAAWIVAMLVFLLAVAYYYTGYSYVKFIKKNEENRRNKKFVITYWAVNTFMIICLIINFCFFFTGHHSNWVATIISYCAAFYAGFFIYSIIIMLICDFFRLLGRAVKYHKRVVKAAKIVTHQGFFAMVIATIIVILGFINVKIPRVVDYRLTLDKKESTIDNLNVVFISDAHIGCAVGENQLKAIVEKTNAVNPDIIILGGDFFDDGTSEEMMQKTSEIFKGFKAKYGTYFVFGNHDTYLGDLEGQAKCYTDAGIKNINDTALNIDGKFYLVGRDDLTYGRKDAQAVFYGVEPDELPVIVVDHEPVYSQMKKVAELGGDLQLSGHTHAGQVFPAYIIDFLKLEPFYGKYTTGDMTTMVSSGVGAWGVPMRIGSPAEIMHINISFK